MTSTRLHDLLGAEPPPGVAALPEQVRDELAAMVVAARRSQADDLEVAFEGVLRTVPFPVRPIARKILLG